MFRLKLKFRVQNKRQKKFLIEFLIISKSILFSVAEIKKKCTFTNKFHIFLVLSRIELFHSANFLYNENSRSKTNNPMFSKLNSGAKLNHYIIGKTPAEFIPQSDSILRRFRSQSAPIEQDSVELADVNPFLTNHYRLNGLIQLSIGTYNLSKPISRTQLCSAE